ncbi:MAG: hypothetical protein BGO43_04385 [Gammaproteobacteria bacterium 39-13]|nr:PD-(D/E)XK nuclease family protein [Gammaproteobacteria bacterium]OJV94921.1 MAG: hypothetical protein BGO43_04385 [Gammaproteobacteria bacterium 39-13]
MDNELVNLLKKSATLITPSRRLAAYVRQEVGRQLAEKGAFETPIVYALEDWLHALWDQFEIRGMIHQQLLTKAQSLLRWEYIIQDANPTLLRPHTAAKTALQAWTNLHHWLVSEVLDEPSENIDQATFQTWAQSYCQWLEENNFIDTVSLCDTLSVFLTNQHKNAIKSISPTFSLILYGFEEMSPLYEQFFKQLALQEWQVLSKMPAPLKPEQIVRNAFLNQEQECIEAALWAKNLLSNGENNIAIVVPNLADMRSTIDRIFKDTFDPLMVCSPEDEVFPHYNISAATPLIQYPIVHAAIGFLKLGLSSWSLSDYSFAINSVFCTANEEEQFFRATLSASLKSVSQEKTTLQAAMLSIWKNKQISVPKWYSMLQNLADVLPSAQQLPFSKWAKVFRKILKVFGWPGERVLNSIEYQTVKRWDELLNELSLCDNVLPQTNFFQALSTLQKLASNIPFQAENKGAPIQILGLLEGVGQQYDNLWVMGLYSEAWPPSPAPNPFISHALQCLKNMPHANAERELVYAKKVTQRFKESARNIIFSYPISDKEKTLEVSELVRDVKLAPTSGSAKLERCEALFLQDTSIELLLDEKAPALSPEEGFTGTATTLALQAACPFKAFAELRLHALLEEASEKWLQPYQQGILLHRVLEEFWQSCPDLNTLCQIEENTLQQKFDGLINKHLVKMRPQEEASPYLEVEKNRLKMILNDYIEIEKRRAPFSVVAIEKRQEFELAGIRFSFRLDRLDKTAENEIIITDYKTGQFKLSELWGERPKSPQLGMYYLASAKIQPKALMVVKLSSQECQFEGVSAKEMGISGVKPIAELKERDEEIPQDWSGLHGYWEHRLNLLAQDFKQGVARVDPVHGASTCQYCHLGPVCRVREKSDL